MNPVVGVILAILIYPGVLVALLAAWVLAWVRGAGQSAISGGAITAPGRLVAELRAEGRREAVTPEGLHPAVLTLATGAAVLFPLLALILLPVPGNPLVSALGLGGDLAAEAALLLGLPLARLLLGWATPSPYTRLAADRGARLLAGAGLPLALAITAAGELSGALRLDVTPPAQAGSPIALVARLLAGLAFACTLPVLARGVALRTAGAADKAAEAGPDADEVMEISGVDLLAFRVGEAIQLVAAGGLFVLAFVLPFFAAVNTTTASNVTLRTVLWIAGLLVVAVGVGAWEGLRASRMNSTTSERPPLTWWLGVPTLLALGALVAAAWVARAV